MQLQQESFTKLLRNRVLLCGSMNAIRPLLPSVAFHMLAISTSHSSKAVIAAFEVEHTTSIYSGIIHMLYLAMGTAKDELNGLFLVAPDDREHEGRAQMRRPAFSNIEHPASRYLLFTVQRTRDIAKHRETIARFGEGMKGILAISHPIP